MKYGESKVLICEIMGLSGYSEKSCVQEVYLPKTSISGHIVSETLAQLHTNPSKLDLGLNAYT